MPDCTLGVENVAPDFWATKGYSELLLIHPLLLFKSEYFSVNSYQQNNHGCQYNDYSKNSRVNLALDMSRWCGLPMCMHIQNLNKIKIMPILNQQQLLYTSQKEFELLKAEWQNIIIKDFRNS